MLSKPKKKVLVTGGAGLLGSSIRDRLWKLYDLYVTCNRDIIVDSRVHVVSCDITDAVQVHELVNNVKPDVIVHCAAITDVDYCEIHPNEAVNVNVHGTANMAQAAQVIGAKFVHISTDSTVDGTLPLPEKYVEEHDPEGINEYSRSKARAEQVARLECDKTLIVRTHFYGWGGLTPKYGPQLVSKLEKGEIVKGFIDMYTSPIYVGHLVDNLYKLIRDHTYGVINVAGNDGVSRYFFAVAIAEIFGLDPRLIEPIEASSLNLSARRPQNTTLDTSKATVLGLYSPSLLDGIRAFRAERG